MPAPNLMAALAVPAVAIAERRNLGLNVLVEVLDGGAVHGRRWRPGSTAWRPCSDKAVAQSHRSTAAAFKPMTALDVVASASTFAAHAPFGGVVHVGFWTRQPDTRQRPATEHVVKHAVNRRRTDHR